jgi:hypothetical protein
MLLYLVKFGKIHDKTQNIQIILCFSFVCSTQLCPFAGIFPSWNVIQK